MEQDRADVELTIQIGAETMEEVLAILTHARNRARSMMLATPEQPVAQKEEQWCSGAMRVTVRRPHMPPVVTAGPAQIPPARAGYESSPAAPPSPLS